MFTDILKYVASIAEKEGRLPKPSPSLLRQIWPQMVGPQIAHLTHPTHLHNTTLTIAVGHRELLKEWQRNYHPLMKRITPLSPWPIERLEFTFDQNAGVEVFIPEPPSTTSTMSESDLADLKERLKQSGLDKELIDTLASIAKKRSSH